jgi:hypothetical protein
VSTGTENGPATGDPAVPGGSSGAASAPSPRAGGALGLARHYRWWFVGAAMVVVSTVLILWARTSPGFDPYGWNVWGFQAIRLNLNLGGAPSWKPVTFLFTVPYSIVGHVSLRLWQITSATVSLAGPIVAGRIVYKVVRDSTGEPRAAIVGAVFSGLCILGIRQYTHYWLSSQSDSMLVTFFLLAIDMHLHGHPRWALSFLWLSSLGRPETWPFYGLYVLWAWRKVPAMRAFIVVETLLIPFFWFGIPVLSGSPWDVASTLAERSPRMCHSGKVICVAQRYLDLSYWPVDLLALVGLVVAAARRSWAVMAVAGCSVLWLILEVGFSLHGFASVPRYMFEAGGTLIVVAGVAVGWILAEALRRGRAAGAGGIAIVAAVAALLVPDAIAQERIEHKDLQHERARTAQIDRLDATINALGGFRFIRTCGDPSADVEYVSILAWYTKMNVGFVGHQPRLEVHKFKQPVVIFTALGNGWIVHTYHLSAAAQARCAGLNNRAYIVTAAHPGGELVNAH